MYFVSLRRLIYVRLFRCHLCGKICLFTIDAVHGHLQCHKINWSAYKQHYLRSDQQPEAKIHHDPSDVREYEDNLPEVMMDLPLQVS